jgi:ABC-type nitrate/sulfonate/bicarbonate transport system substrate-binding protein
MKRPFSLLALMLAATVAAGCDTESTPTAQATPVTPAAPVVAAETGKSAPKKPMSEVRKAKPSPKVRNDL